MRFWDPLQEYRPVAAHMCVEAQLAARSHPTRPMLVTAANDSTLHAWAMDAAALERNERPVRTAKFVGHADVVLDLLFLPSINALCSASLDGRLHRRHSNN